MIPGAPNPLMWGGGDPLDELGKIDRALRLRAAASAYLTRTPAGNGNLLKWTMSLWIKRGSLGTLMGILTAVQGGGNSEQIRFDGSNDTISYTDGASGGVQSAVFAGARRDPASHMHVVLGYDSANATAANRVTLEINGVLVGQTSINITQNRNSSINTAVAHRIGLIDGFANSDFTISQFAFVDGQKLASSAFAQAHARTNQWRPKSKAAIRAAVAVAGGARNGWGTNGCLLPFDDNTSTTTLGYDRSQSDTDTTGNNWTLTNVSLAAGATYDSVLDTPTGNYCVWNTLDKAGSGVVADGSLAFSNAAANYSPVRTTFLGDKAYAEFKSNSNTSSSVVIAVGLIAASRVLDTSVSGYNTSQCWDLYLANVSNINNSGSITGAGAAGVVGDIYKVYYDKTAGKAWIGKNASWYDSAFGTTGDPSTGANPTFSGLSGDMLLFASCYAAGLSANFGQQPFNYTPPTPAQANSTKKLSLNYPVMKSESAFVARTDTGANIVATLSAAAPWADWIRIYKRRDAAEGWRWQFSDDSANYMDSSSTAAKAAFPALGGTSYVGYALRVAAANGVATGRLVHVNGVADVVADGLGKSRKMVILKNEGTGSWYVYHPDLTAGKLLYLEQNVGETVDATISSVNSSGFTVAAALASGTYRWISIAEIDGFIKLGKYAGNGVSDGPFVSEGLCPVFSLTKSPSAAGANYEWYVFDSKRDVDNVITGSDLEMNSTNAEGISKPSYALDYVSNGRKLRSFSEGINYTSGFNYVHLSIAAFPFRYANAR